MRAVLLLLELAIGGIASGELDWAAGGSDRHRLSASQMVEELTLDRRPAGSHDCRQAELSKSIDVGISCTNQCALGSRSHTLFFLVVRLVCALDRCCHCG